MSLFKNRLCNTTAMVCDPVSLGLAGSAIVSFFSTTVVAGVTVGSIALTAALSGASYLLNAAFAPGTPKPGADQGQKLTVQQAVPSQRLIYGQALVGGPIFFYEVKPPYLYLGIVLASHEIDSVPEIRIGDEPAILDPDGNAINSKFNNGTDSYLKVSIRLGTADQAIDPLLAADFPELPSTFRQRGHATAVLRMDYAGTAANHEKYWGSGSPKPYFLVRGMKVYDPRKAGHSVSDSSTWEWSDNASLCLAHYLTYEKGLARPWSKIMMETLIQGANDDAQQVQLLSGDFEARYTINGVIDTATPPVQVIQDMLTANLGRLVWSNGKYAFFSGVPRDPVWTLNDDSARGSMEVRYDRPRRELVNTVRTVFTSPEREYQQAQGPVVTNAGYIAADGEAHEITVTLPLTSTHTRAQRIGKVMIEKSRLGKLVSRREDIASMKLLAAEMVNLDSVAFPRAAMLAEINAAVLSDESLEVEMDLEQYSPSIYDWTASDDEQPFEIAPTELEGVT